MEQEVEGKNNLTLPAVIFIVAGLIVTFTQSLHDNPTFNAWLIAGFGLVFAAHSFTRWFKSKKAQTGFVFLVQAISTIALAVFVAVTREQQTIHLSLLIWAAINVATYVYAWVLTKTKNFLALAVFGTLFVLALAFLAHDLAAVVGLFASFSIMLGVYLAISAFDPKKNLQESTDKTGISV